MKAFDLDEDFEIIIKAALKPRKVIAIRAVDTGWTNIVFEAETGDGNFFCRFPRDEFWGKAIIKDHEFSKFVGGKTPFATSELDLCRDAGRPFSIHRKIEGEVLADVMAELNAEEVEVVAQDIALFMKALHSIDGNEVDVFQENQLPVAIGEFLDHLVRYHIPDHPEEFFDEIYIRHPEGAPRCFIHGDLNARNILLGPDRHMVGVLDFAFGGIGAASDDLSRLVSTCTENLVDPIISATLKAENIPLERSDILERAARYHRIDLLYIDYLKSLGLA